MFQLTWKTCWNILDWWFKKKRKKKEIQNTYSLNLTVSTIKDGDTQLKGGSHHRTSLTCVEKKMKFIICGQESD